MGTAGAGELEIPAVKWIRIWLQQHDRGKTMLKSLIFFVLTNVVISVTAQAQADLPKVRIVATGGTIAGEQREPGTLVRYEIKKTANEIVAMVPEIRRYAQVETEQFSNLPSPGVTPEHWLRLARRINELFLESPDLAGVVVTHGTARLEETAFFLHLTVKSDRPVVVVGAQRPPTGISPDGPINLLSAVRLAASPEARGKGVMVVMDERILSARETRKIYARGGGFETGEMGMLGVVATHGVEFFYAPARKHTTMTDFDVSGIQSLPPVHVTYSYAGAEGIAENNARAIIVATTGFTPAEQKYYEGVRKKGVIVATTFPTGDQVGSPGLPQKDVPPLIIVKHMLPTKARILMMLALTKTQEPAEIQKIFDEY